VLGVDILCSLAGMSRSVTVAVAYIMSVTNLGWKEALKVVKVGRAVANPNLGFQRQLDEFEAFKLVEVRQFFNNSVNLQCNFVSKIIKCGPLRTYAN
jgi:protein-tyrosine phosphatase